MKTYKWQKEFINGKWYTVCTSHKHVPLVKWNSDGTYTVKGSDGKPRIEKEFKDAINFAIETYRKMSKFNKEWEEEKLRVPTSRKNKNDYELNATEKYNYTYQQAVDDMNGWR